MDTLMILYRALHVVAGAFWVGAALMLVAFVMPAVGAMGPEGGRFMQGLMRERRLPAFMTLAGLLTTVFGLLLLWRTSGGLQAHWLRSGMGCVLLIASLVGIAALATGLLVNKPAAQRMSELSASIQAAGQPPTSGQRAEMVALQGRLARGSVWGAGLLVVCTVGMAVARYAGF